jgi:hypothetical protein
MLMVLYIMSAMGIKIYPNDPYEVIYVGSASVIRDFTTFPPWAILAILTFISEIAFKRLPRFNLLSNIVGTGILFSGILMMLTRSTVISIVICVGVLLIFLLMQKGIRQKLLAITLGFILIIGVLLVIRMAPANWHTFTDRLNILGNNPLGDTLGYRLQLFDKLRQYIHNIDPFWGVGFNPLSFIRQQSPITYWGDMMWYTVLNYFGWFGFSIISLFLFFSLFRSGWNAVITRRGDQVISWVFFLYCIYNLTITLTNPSYFMLYAVSTLGIAGVIVQESRLWVTQPQTRSFNSFFSGIGTARILGPGKYFLLRRLAVVIALCVLAFYVGSRMAK